MPRLLEGSSKTITFSDAVTFGPDVYTGPVKWEVTDENGTTTEVLDGAPVTTAAVTATLDPSAPQSLSLSKVAEGIPFSVKASFAGSFHQCSVASQQIDLQWASPLVVFPSLCVQ